MALEDDLRAEGEPEKEFNPGIASRLPRKRVAAGALFRDDHGRILMLEPIYKPTWDIPGGLVDDDESPLEACSREVREELKLDVPIGPLLVVDWIPRHGVWTDGLMFIFDGGILSPDQVSCIHLQDDELTSFAFLSLDEVAARVRPSMARRLAACMTALTTGLPTYVQFGRVPGSG